MSILEAMAQARPVVATAVGGVPEVLRGCGIVPPPGDVHAIATGVGTLLRNPELAAHLGRRGFARVHRHLHAEGLPGRISATCSASSQARRWRREARRPQRPHAGDRRHPAGDLTRWSTPGHQYAAGVIEARLGRGAQDVLEAAVVLEAWGGVRAGRALSLGSRVVPPETAALDARATDHRGAGPARRHPHARPSP